jgi:dipeptidyl aminopeptidase/acylaminoacyl peptidase
MERPAALTPTPSPTIEPPAAGDELSFNPSPNGRWTAVVNQTAGSLVLQDLDGQTAVIFPPDDTVGAVSWSPDSRRLLVVRTNWIFSRPDGTGVGSASPIEIWAVELKDDQPQTPTRLFQSKTAPTQESAEQIVFGHWSPNSQYALFWLGPLSASILADGLPLFIIDLSNKQVNQLANVTLLNPRYQSWAPDSSALVFTEGGYRSAQVGKSLALFETASGQTTTLIDENEQVPGIVAWSPRGDLIAYAAVPAAETGPQWADLMTFDNPAIAGRRIYLLDPATGEPRRLNDAATFQDAPVWSDDGSTLYYAQREGDQLQVMAAVPATGESEPVVGAAIPLPEMVGYYGQSDLDALLASRPGGELGSAPTPQTQTTPTPAILASADDLELVRFIFKNHPPELGTLTGDFLKRVAEGQYTDFTRQDVDISGDGEPENLVSGRADTFHLFVAILRRSAAGQLRELFYTANNNGKYLGEVRMTVDKNRRVIAAFLTSTGGTGYLETTWEERWLECEADSCTLVWSGPKLWTSRTATWQLERHYVVTTLEQPDPNTIQLATRRFGLAIPLVAEGFEPLGPARRIVGPDNLETYSRTGHGEVYQQTSWRQTTPGQEISREFDLQTQETNNLVHELASQPFYAADSSFDAEGYNQLQAEVWDLSQAGQAEDPIWGIGSRQADIAAHNGWPGQLGEWVAGVIGSLDATQCRLVVQRQVGGSLNLVGRTNLLCAANLTHLDWTDVTGDGEDELLLATFPPDADGQTQRLYVYTISGDQLAELAHLDGSVNGPDGVGVRWEKTSEGFKVETGLPLVDPDAFPTLDNLRLGREFQTYVWNEADHSFRLEQ